MKSYKDLDVYKKSLELAVLVHEFSLELPKFELYEEGSQLRRAAKSIPANISEGYGRRRYKADFIKFLIYAQSSCDETIVHLNLLIKTHALNEKWNELISNYEILGKQLNLFIQYVEKKWNNN